MAFSKLQLLALASLMALAVVWSAASSEAAITCGAVESNLISCLSYLQGKVAAAPASCCTGVNKLYGLTKSSKPDRVAACKCITQLAKSFPNLQAARIGGLPNNCKVNLGYKPSINTNCAA